MKTQLATSFFKPQGNIKAVMLVVHGMAEHRKRYDEFATALSEQGIGVLTYDQRGHGESVNDSSELGYFGSENGWLNLVEDTADFLKQLKREYRVPVILFGHSMGSMVSRCVLKRYEELIDAVILSGAPNYVPVAGAGRAVAKLISAFGEKKRSSLLHNMAEGGFIKSIENPETEVDWLSYDKDNVKKYIADPLCGFTFTARGYQDLMSLMVDMHQIEKKTKKSHLPILFVSGADDPCTGGPKGLDDSIAVLKQTGYEKITNLVYKNARHEILNEKIADKVIEDIVQWVEKAF